MVDCTDRVLPVGTLPSMMQVHGREIEDLPVCDGHSRTNSNMTAMAAMPSQLTQIVLLARLSHSRGIGYRGGTVHAAFLFPSFGKVFAGVRQACCFPCSAKGAQNRQGEEKVKLSTRCWFPSSLAYGLVDGALLHRPSKALVL